MYTCANEAHSTSQWCSCSQLGVSMARLRFQWMPSHKFKQHWSESYTTPFKHSRNIIRRLVKSQDKAQHYWAFREHRVVPAGRWNEDTLLASGVLTANHWKSRSRTPDSQCKESNPETPAPGYGQRRCMQVLFRQISRQRHTRTHGLEQTEWQTHTHTYSPSKPGFLSSSSRLWWHDQGCTA